MFIKIISLFPENCSNHTIAHWGQVAEFSQCPGG